MQISVRTCVNRDHGSARAGEEPDCSGCAGCPGSHHPTHRKCHSPWALTGLFQTLTMGEAAMRLFCIKQEFTEFFFSIFIGCK